MIEFDSVVSSLKFIFFFPIVIVFQLLLTSLVSLSWILLEYYLPAPLSLISFLILLVLSVIQIGSYPLFVEQAVKKGKVKIFEALKKVFSRGVSIVSYYILIVLILLFPLSLLTYGIYFLTMRSTGFILLLIFSSILLVFEVVILLKLWLVFPIMMVEEKGVVDSIKLSWERSRGKVLSIFLTLAIFMFLVFLPLFVILSISFFLSSEVFNFLNLVVSSLIASAGSSLPTIYYLKVKKRR